ncbi:hypothetical protein A3759_05945 [Thalassolituus sp. HI0120]|nr:hypothetical protein A3759_05945 [Thalassolituus sp. HI0120]
MKTIRIYFAILVLFSLNSYSAQNCTTQPVSWDWHKDNYRVINDTQGYAIIPSPFRAGYSIGVDVAQTSHCPENGWLLYDYKSFCESDDVNCNNVSLNDTTYRPSFVLYNKYTGQLRFFIYTTGFERNDDEILVDVSITQGTSGESNVPALMNGKAPIVVYSEKNESLNTSNEENWLFFESIPDKWLVFDKYLSYSPTAKSEPKNSRITLRISQKDTANIHINGALEFTTSETLETQPGGNIGLSDLSKAAAAYSSPQEWSNDLKSMGDSLQNSSSTFKQKIGGYATNIASLIASNTTPLGVLSAGFSLYSSYTGSSTKSYMSLYSEGTLSLEGTITEQSPIEVIQYGFFGSDQDRTSDIPEIAKLQYVNNYGSLHINQRPNVVFDISTIHFDPNKFDDSLGLLSVARPDGTSVRAVSYDFLQYKVNIQDLLDSIIVNPETDMDIRDVAVKPVFITSKRWNHNIRTSDEELFETTNYHSAMVPGGHLGYTERRIQFSKFKYTSFYGAEDYGAKELSPNRMQTLLRNGYRSGKVRNSEFLTGYFNDFFYAYYYGGRGWTKSLNIDKFYLDVYVLLRGKSDPTRFVEKKLRVPVNIGTCYPDFRNKDHFNGHEQDKFFQPTQDQCTSIRTVEKPVRWNDIYYNTSDLKRKMDQTTDRIWASDTNADGFCQSEYGTTFDSYTYECGSDEEGFAYYVPRTELWLIKDSGSSSRVCYKIIDSITCKQSRWQ